MSEEKKTHWSTLSDASKKRYNEWKKGVLAEKRERGECYQCSEPAVNGYRYCAKHMETKREARRKTREKYLKNRQCPTCATVLEKDDDKVYCPSCRERAKERREQFFSVGLCKRCGKEPHMENKMTCGSCAERSRVLANSTNTDLREDVLRGYGGKCVCCGETISRFLTIDHKNNDGAERRKEGYHIGPALYREIIEEGFPDDLQLLCFNCNAGKHLNGGICPHQDCTYRERPAPYFPICINPHTTGIDSSGQPYPLTTEEAKAE